MLHFSGFLYPGSPSATVRDMAEVIELALHARARRILFLFLRRHGLDFFLEQRDDESFSRLDDRKIDLVMRLACEARRVPFGVDTEQQDDSARGMVRRILIRRLALSLVEAGY